MLQPATTTAVWSALGTLTAPASSASTEESACHSSPTEPRASPMIGAHPVPARIMFAPELCFGDTKTLTIYEIWKKITLSIEKYTIGSRSTKMRLVFLLLFYPSS